MIVNQELRIRLCHLWSLHNVEAQRFFRLWLALEGVGDGREIALVCPRCSWEPAWLGQSTCPVHANPDHGACLGSGEPLTVKVVARNPSEMSAAALESGATEELKDV